MTEETCGCWIDYGSIEDEFGMTICERCGKEIPDCYSGFPGVPMTVPLPAELYRTESPIFNVKVKRK